MNEMNNKTRILIMAGGTGGHIYPALSIARYLGARGVEVEWLGTRKGLEAEVIPEAGLPLHFIPVAGLRGKSLLRKVLAPVVLLLAVIQAVRKVKAVKPHCVLGMGGFATGPGGLAAWLLRKNLLIHEQNAIAGFTNQMLTPFAAVIMEAFPGAFERKREITANPLLRRLSGSRKAVAVGNPVREDIAALPAPEERFAGRGEGLRVLVLGGSRGAAAINKVLPEALAAFGENSRPRVWHQCGHGNIEETRGFYSGHGIGLDDNVRVADFIGDMAGAYGWADLVICRAGALTVAEIAAAGVASILVPFPFAVDDHQAANAAVLTGAGAGVMIRQDDLSAETLHNELVRFAGDRERLLHCANAARSVAQPRATELAAGLCLEACHG